MQSRVPLAFTLIALIGSGVTFAAIHANAQQPPGPPPLPPGMEKHAPHWAFSAADHAAFFDARIAALRAGLKLTPEQEKLWPPIEAALRAGDKSAIERHEKLRNEPRPSDIIVRLRQISEAETAHGETLKAIADAASPLYATLSEEQKHRLPFLIRAIRPHFFGGHFGPMGEGPHGWRGEGGEHGPRGEGPHGWRGEGDEHEGFASHEDGRRDDEHHSSEDDWR